MRRTGCLALVALVSSGAAAQNLVNGHGVPPQIVPLYQERGAPSFTVAPGGSGAGVGGLGGVPALSDLAAPNAGVSAPAGSAVAALQETGYADAAQAAAAQAGINIELLAGIGQIESNFRNIPAANGSTTANGFWQITNGTWNETVTRDGLGYSPADASNPANQAVVASYPLPRHCPGDIEFDGATSDDAGHLRRLSVRYKQWRRDCNQRRRHSAQRNRPAVISRQQWDAELDRRRLSEPDGCEVGIDREPGGADHGRAIYFPNRAGSCGKCAPQFL